MDRKVDFSAVGGASQLGWKTGLFHFGSNPGRPFFELWPIFFVFMLSSVFNHIMKKRLGVVALVTFAFSTGLALGLSADNSPYLKNLFALEQEPPTILTPKIVAAEQASSSPTPVQASSSPTPVQPDVPVPAISPILPTNLASPVTAQQNIPDLAGEWDMKDDSTDYTLKFMQKNGSLTGTFQDNAPACDEDENLELAITGTVNPDRTFIFTSGNAIEYKGRFEQRASGAGVLQGSYIYLNRTGSWSALRRAPATLLLAEGGYDGEVSQSLEIHAKVSQLNDTERNYLKKLALLYLSLNLRGSLIYQSPPLINPKEFVTSGDLSKIMAEAKFKLWAALCANNPLDT
ncbi:hypothetical protein WDW86_06370 [Bdellovibrionota bacterium FG-2]